MEKVFTFQEMVELGIAIEWQLASCKKRISVMQSLLSKPESEFIESEREEYLGYIVECFKTIEILSSALVKIRKLTL